MHLTLGGYHFQQKKTPIVKTAHYSSTIATDSMRGFVEEETLNNMKIIMISIDNNKKSL